MHGIMLLAAGMSWLVRDRKSVQSWLGGWRRLPVCCVHWLPVCAIPTALSMCPCCLVPDQSQRWRELASEDMRVQLKVQHCVHVIIALGSGQAAALGGSCHAIIQVGHSSSSCMHISSAAWG
jgi:hypothetical protein